MRLFSLSKYFRESFGRVLLNEQIASHAHLITGSILDVGSGSRRYDQLFEGQVTAIDIHPDAERAITYGDIHAIPFPDQSFDSVVSFEVLCYSPDVRAALQELMRILKPGGHLLLSTPFLLRDSGDRIRLTKRYLEELLAELQPKSAEVIACGNAWTILWDILRSRIVNTTSRPKKILLSLLFLPVLMVILTLRLDQVSTPHYAAEYFAVITK